MNKMLVSIIVPVYNVKNYLEQCVKSILSQTYKNLEVLLIDDGSTDGSGLICDRFAVSDKRIKVFHCVNGGVSAARNTGIQKCTGQWISFVDSDDFVYPDMIETLLDAAVENKAQIAIGETTQTDKNAEDFSHMEEAFESRRVRPIDGITILENLLNNKMRKSIWGMLFDTKLVRKTRFSTGRIYEDLPYLPLVLRSRPGIVWVDKTVYVYRMNPDSITHQKINMKTGDRIIMKELQAKRIGKYFPELRALAVGGLYADCMMWWIKADEADDKRAGNRLKHVIEKSIKRNPLSWNIIFDSKLPSGRRASLIASKLSFIASSKIKKYVVQVIHRQA